MPSARACTRLWRVLHECIDRRRLLTLTLCPAGKRLAVITLRHAAWWSDGDVGPGLQRRPGGASVQGGLQSSLMCAPALGISGRPHCTNATSCCTSQLDAAHHVQLGTLARPVSACAWTTATREGNRAANPSWAGSLPQTAGTGSRLSGVHYSLQAWPQMPEAMLEGLSPHSDSPDLVSDVPSSQPAQPGLIPLLGLSLLARSQQKLMSQTVDSLSLMQPDIAYGLNDTRTFIVLQLPLHLYVHAVGQVWEIWLPERIWCQPPAQLSEPAALAPWEPGRAVISGLAGTFPFPQAWLSGGQRPSRRRWALLLTAWAFPVPAAAASQPAGGMPMPCANCAALDWLSSCCSQRAFDPCWLSCQASGAWP